MQPEYPRSREDAYREFIEFVRSDIQQERSLVNRRMFNVFLWCFALPAIVSLTMLLLIKFRVLPMKARAFQDWMVLAFPVCYSLYILGSEVIAQVPTVIRKGGVSGTLGQALKDAQWRARVVEAMGRSVRAAEGEWGWIIESYRIDMATLQHRTRYLTALAGAVFFLIMQGIDTLAGVAETEAHVSWSRNPITGWIETATYDLSQFVGLGLFLVLLYLSGNQTYHSLVRYLHCAELNRGAARKKL